MNKKPINVYQFFHSGVEIPPEYQRCMEQIQALEWIDLYHLVRFPCPPGRNPALITDGLRLEIARVEPWGLFIDADLVLTNRPDFSRDGLPYFAELPDHKRQTTEPHISIFFVNDCCGWFRELELPPPECRIKRGWTNHVLRGRPFYPITTDTFDHKFIQARSIPRENHRQPVA